MQLLSKTHLCKGIFTGKWKYSLKIYAAVAVLSLGFSKGSKMDSEVLTKPLQNIMCLPQIPA